MKLMHLSDLHIGKRVNEFSMIEDQRYIFGEIFRIARENEVEGILIAGDIYDKSIPPVEAVSLFNDFLNKAVSERLELFIISGNHDSSERMAFGADLMEHSGVHIVSVYAPDTEAVTVEDEYGDINIYMLPFIKPVHIQRIYEDEDINTYTEAVRKAVDNINVDKSKRNILITHQFITGAERCESEDISIGGADNVDVEVFDDFDYVALGHLHGPQKVVCDTVRYCGTPLKYSFSEINHRKSVTIVEFKEKGSIEIETAELKPLRDMIEIKGKYEELVGREFYSKLDKESYIHAILTDEEDVFGAISKLRAVYPNIMKLDYDNVRTRSSSVIKALEELESKKPQELFKELYRQQNNRDITEEQEALLNDLVEEIWEEMQ